MKKDLLFAAAAVMALVSMPVQAQNSRIVEDGGSGPYKAIMMEEASLTTHTIFRPQDLSKFDKKNLLPVIVWGNGGCANSPSGHVNFLNEVASQGFLIVAIGPSNYQQQEAPRPGQTGDVPRMGQGGVLRVAECPVWAVECPAVWVAECQWVTPQASSRLLSGQSLRMPIRTAPTMASLI